MQQTTHDAAPTRQRRRPGPPRRLEPGMVQTTFWAPPDLLDWAKKHPEGMAALLRRLLEEERRRGAA